MSSSLTLSLTSTAGITDISERTWWRRIKQGVIQRGSTGAGKNTRLMLSDVLPEIAFTLMTGDIEVILEADAGNSEAQNDLAMMLMTAGKSKAAQYWLHQSAQKSNADSMQWLAHCYARGEGVHKDENLSIMWLSKAASVGHVIAKAQMGGILKGFLAGDNASNSSDANEFRAKSMIQTEVVC